MRVFSPKFDARRVRGHVVVFRPSLHLESFARGPFGMRVLGPILNAEHFVSHLGAARMYVDRLICVHRRLALSARRRVSDCPAYSCLSRNLASWKREPFPAGCGAAAPDPTSPRQPPQRRGPCKSYSCGLLCYNPGRCWHEALMRSLVLAMAQSFDNLVLLLAAHKRAG